MLAAKEAAFTRQEIGAVIIRKCFPFVSKKRAKHLSGPSTYASTYPQDTVHKVPAEFPN